MPRAPLIALLLSALLGAIPARARADEAAERAKRHNYAGKVLFNLGRFGEAADEYQKAYAAKPSPAYLFNLAQCFKRMTRIEHLRKAIFYYRSYLANEPLTPLRANVEEEIAKLEREIQVLGRPPPFYKRWWFWTVVGVAVTGAAVGTAFALRPADQQPIAGTGGNFEL